MIRRSRLSFKPNVRPGGRAPGSRDGGAAPQPAEPAQSGENVVTEGPEESDKLTLCPADRGEEQSQEPTGPEQTENAPTVISDSQPSKPASAPLQRRKRISTLPNLAKPRVSSAAAATPQKAPQVDVPAVLPSSSVPSGDEPAPPEKTKTLSPPKSQGPNVAALGQPVQLPEKRTPVPQVPQFSPYKKSSLKAVEASPVKHVASLPKGELSPLKERPSQKSSTKDDLSALKKITPKKLVSVGNLEKERLRRAQKLRDLLRDELQKERKAWRAKHPVITNGIEIERSKMTMRDFIYFIPTSNPMTTSFADTKSFEKIPTDSQVTGTPVKSLLNDDEDDIDEEEDEGQMLAPRVKVAEDGSIILDEESLTVEVSRNKAPIVEGNEPIFERGSTTTYSSFRKSNYSKPWSEPETNMFYLAISMVGTDFSMIGQLFPHRDRIEIKNKFKREERANGWRIDKAFREKVTLDLDFFAKHLEKALEEGKKKPKAPRIRKPREKKARKPRKKKDKAAAEEILSDGNLPICQMEKKPMLGYKDGSSDLAANDENPEEVQPAAEEKVREKKRKTRKKKSDTKDLENDIDSEQSRQMDELTSKSENLTISDNTEDASQVSTEAGEASLLSQCITQADDFLVLFSEESDCDSEPDDLTRLLKELCETSLKDETPEEASSTLDVAATAKKRAVPKLQTRRRKVSDIDSKTLPEEDSAVASQSEPVSKDDELSTSKDVQKAPSVKHAALTRGRSQRPRPNIPVKALARQEKVYAAEEMDTTEESNEAEDSITLTQSQKEDTAMTEDSITLTQSHKEDTTVTEDSISLTQSHKEDTAVTEDSITLTQSHKGDTAVTEELISEALEVSGSGSSSTSDPASAPPLGPAETESASESSQPQPGDSDSAPQHSDAAKEEAIKEKPSLPMRGRLKPKPNLANALVKSKPAAPEPSTCPASDSIDSSQEIPDTNKTPLVNDVTVTSQAEAVTEDEEAAKSQDVQKAPSVKPAALTRGRFQRPRPNIPVKALARQEKVLAAEEMDTTEESHELEDSISLTQSHQQDTAMTEELFTEDLEGTGTGSSSTSDPVSVPSPGPVQKDSASKASQPQPDSDSVPQSSDAAKQDATKQDAIKEKPSLPVRGRLRPKPNLAKAPVKSKPAAPEISACPASDSMDYSQEISDIASKLPLEDKSVPNLEEGATKDEESAKSQGVQKAPSVKPAALTRGRFQRPRPNIPVKVLARQEKVSAAEEIDTTEERNQAAAEGSITLTQSHREDIAVTEDSISLTQSHKEDIAVTEELITEDLEVSGSGSSSTSDPVSVPSPGPAEKESASESSQPQPVDSESAPQHSDAAKEEAIKEKPSLPVRGRLKPKPNLAKAPVKSKPAAPEPSACPASDLVDSSQPTSSIAHKILEEEMAVASQAEAVAKDEESAKSQDVQKAPSVKPAALTRGRSQRPRPNIPVKALARQEKVSAAEELDTTQESNKAEDSISLTQSHKEDTAMTEDSISLTQSHKEDTAVTEELITEDLEVSRTGSGHTSDPASVPSSGPVQKDSASESSQSQPGDSCSVPQTSEVAKQDIVKEKPSLPVRGRFRPKPNLAKAPVKSKPAAPETSACLAFDSEMSCSIVLSPLRTPTDEQLHKVQEKSEPSTSSQNARPAIKPAPLVRGRLQRPKPNTVRLTKEEKSHESSKEVSGASAGEATEGRFLPECVRSYAKSENHEKLTEREKSCLDSSTVPPEKESLYEPVAGTPDLSHTDPVPAVTALAESQAASHAATSESAGLEAALSSDATVEAALSSDATVEAALSSDATVEAALSSDATVEAALSSDATVEAALSSDATVEAALSSDATVEAALSSDATVEAALSSDATVEAALSSDATVEAALSSDATVEAALSSDATVEAALSSDATVEAALSSDATVEAALSSDATVEAALSSDATVEAALSSDATVEAPLSSDATVEAALSSDARVEAALSSDAAVEAAHSSDAAVEAALSSDATVEAALSSDATVEAALSSDATVEAALSSDATVEAALSSDATVAAALSSDATVEAALSSDATVEAALSSDATVEAALSSDATVEAALSSDATVEAALSSDATVEAALSSDATVEAALSSDATVEAALSSDATVEAALSSDATVEAALSSDATMEAALSSDAGVEAALSSESKDDSHILGKPANLTKEGKEVPSADQQEACAKPAQADPSPPGGLEPKPCERLTEHSKKPVKPAVLPRGRFQRPKPNLGRALAKRGLRPSSDESKSESEGEFRDTPTESNQVTSNLLQPDADKMCLIAKTDEEVTSAPVTKSQVPPLETSAMPCADLVVKEGSLDGSSHAIRNKEEEKMLEPPKPAATRSRLQRPKPNLSKSVTPSPVSAPRKCDEHNESRTSEGQSDAFEMVSQYDAEKDKSIVNSDGEDTASLIEVTQSYVLPLDTFGSPDLDQTDSEKSDSVSMDNTSIVMINKQLSGSEEDEKKKSPPKPAVTKSRLQRPKPNLGRSAARRSVSAPQQCDEGAEGRIGTGSTEPLENVRTLSQSDADKEDKSSPKEITVSPVPLLKTAAAPCVDKTDTVSDSVAGSSHVISKKDEGKVEPSKPSLSRNRFQRPKPNLDRSVTRPTLSAPQNVDDHGKNKTRESSTDSLENVLECDAGTDGDSLIVKSDGEDAASAVELTRSFIIPLDSFALSDLDGADSNEKAASVPVTNSSSAKLKKELSGSEGKKKVEPKPSLTKSRLQRPKPNLGRSVARPSVSVPEECGDHRQSRTSINTLSTEDGDSSGNKRTVELLSCGVTETESCTALENSYPCSEDGQGGSVMVCLQPQEVASPGGSSGKSHRNRFQKPKPNLAQASARKESPSAEPRTSASLQEGGKLVASNIPEKLQSTDHTISKYFRAPQEVASPGGSSGKSHRNRFQKPKPNLAQASARKESASAKPRTSASLQEGGKLVASNIPEKLRSTDHTISKYFTDGNTRKPAQSTIKPAQLRRGRSVGAVPSLLKPTNRKAAPPQSNEEEASLSGKDSEAEVSQSPSVGKRKASESFPDVSPKRTCPDQSQKPLCSADSEDGQVITTKDLQTDNQSNDASEDRRQQHSRLSKLRKRPIPTTPSVPSRPSESSSERPEKKTARGGKSSKSKVAKPALNKSRGKTTLVKLRAKQQDEEEEDEAGLDFEEEDYNVSPDKLNQAPVFVPFSLRSPRPVPAEIEETVEELEIPVEDSYDSTKTCQNLGGSPCLPLQDESQGVSESQADPFSKGHCDGSTEVAMTLISMGSSVFQSDSGESVASDDCTEWEQLSSTDHQTDIKNVTECTSESFTVCEQQVCSAEDDASRPVDAFAADARSFKAENTTQPASPEEQKSVALLTSDHHASEPSSAALNDSIGFPLEQRSYPIKQEDSPQPDFTCQEVSVQESLLEDDPAGEATFILTLVEIPLTDQYSFSCDVSPADVLPAPVMITSGSSQVLSQPQDQSFGSAALSEQSPDEPCPPAPVQADLSLSTSCRKRSASSEGCEQPYKKPVLCSTAEGEDHEAENTVTEGNPNADKTPKNIKMEEVGESCQHSAGITCCTEGEQPSECSSVSSENSAAICTDKPTTTSLASLSRSLPSGSANAASSSETPLQRPGKKPLGFLSLVCKEKQSKKSKAVTKKKNVPKCKKTPFQKLKEQGSSENCEQPPNNDVPSESSPAVATPTDEESIPSTSQVPETQDDSVSEELPKSQDLLSEEEPAQVSQYFFSDIFMEVDN
ncbi:transcription factor TFIIIB component B'' homolog [Hyperolius riggenbachi]|uniref:transcription factor TFIIIB component B'' homolog n=1 Tax=Hyperolius riggenbachi TaxID=752182 RepID=UPI0035A3117D